MNEIDLLHLGTMRVELDMDATFIPNGPKGTRIIAEVAAARLEGPRIAASLRGRAAADWLTLAPDGSFGSVDVRGTLLTDDGAAIFVSYLGRVDMATNTVFTSPLFETGDERYDWLNRIQCVAKGTLDPATGVLTYDVYELR
jgi:hypothetical protein